MIELIKIKNYALIEDSEIELGSGLNIITGETGAGKSLFINAIFLLIGEKSSSNIIGKNGKEASVEAIVKLNKDLEKRLNKNEIKLDGSTVLIKRVFGDKNRCYINGELVSLAQLKEVMKDMIDICSQHENQSILDAANQRKLVDAYSGQPNLLDVVRQTFKERSKARSEKEALKKLQLETQTKLDYIEFQLSEIKKVNPKADDEKLTAIIQSVKQKEALGKIYGRVEENLFGGEGVVSKLKDVHYDLKEIDKLQNLDNASKLKEIMDQLEDFSDTLVLKDSEMDPDELQDLMDRSDAVNKLKRKHGGSLETLLEAREKLEAQLDDFDNFDVNIKKLEAQISELDKSYKEKSKKLSDAREKTAKKLSGLIKSNLVELNMPNVKIDISVKAGDETEFGKDIISFLISPHSGEALGELSKIASGGELSRVILAIHNVINEKKLFYLFDEVDAGIGGDTGVKVGIKLKSMSSDNQILCITHLPQVAAYADHHYRIEKIEQKDKTVSKISKLLVKQQQEELARMLGSSMVGTKALENAKEMLQKAKK